MRDSGRSITITTPSYGPRRFNVIRCALQSITFNFSEIPRRSMPIGVLGKRITKTTPSHGPGRFNVIRCAPQSITFNTFTISAIPDSCLLSPLSMPFELSLDIIYRIQNVLYPASYLSVGIKPTPICNGTEVVCLPDDITDKKQQVRRASGFTTIDTNFLQTSSGGSTTILRGDSTAF